MRLIYRICFFNINYNVRLKHIKLGQVFLNNYYLILNYENNTVGLVQSEQGNIVFTRDTKWRQQMMVAITVWTLAFIAIALCNQRDIQTYNRIVNKFIVYIYKRVFENSQQQLDFTETSISYKHYDEFMEYLNNGNSRNGDDGMISSVSISGYMRNAENVDSIQIQRNLELVNGNNIEQSVVSNMDGISNLNNLRTQNQRLTNNTRSISRVTQQQSIRYVNQRRFQPIHNIGRVDNNNELQSNNVIRMNNQVNHTNNNNIIARQRRIMIAQSSRNDNNSRSLNFLTSSDQL